MAKVRENTRIIAERRGRRAETMALWLLRLKGYRILSQRYKSPVGEIDLIAKRGNLLAFVEVKARHTDAAAMHSITLRQQQRIRRAADHYLATNINYQNMDLRFDAVFVVPRKWPRHLAGAWRV